MRTRAAVLGAIMSLAAAGPADAVGQVTINESGAASPYPSVLEATDAAGIIEDVDVRITALAHDFPDELDIAVAGPDGTAVLLMSDAGQATLSPCIPDLRFSSQATTSVPSSELPCNGTFVPTDDDSDEFDSDVFPVPGPAEPFAGSLAAFNGQAAVGSWKLYVVDDTFGDGGSISSWRVDLNTRPLAPSSIGLIPLRNERDAGVPVKITRTGGSAQAPLQAATVAWSTEPCAILPQAIVGADFGNGSGSVDFAAGQSEAFAEIRLVDDQVPEPQECVNVRLVSTTGDAVLDSASPQVQTFRITDDDPRASTPRVSVTQGQRVLREKAVVVTATSRSAGTLSAKGKIGIPQKASAFLRLKPARANVQPGVPARLRLALSKKALRGVRRAFQKRRALYAYVRVTATDLAGGQAAKAVTVKLRRG